VKARDPKKRLAATRAKIAQLREELAVLDEQLAYQESVAGDESTRAVVSEAPASKREAAAAGDDVRRTRRERDETQARLQKLSAKQDRLLEQLEASAQESAGSPERSPASEGGRRRRPR
jgi:glutathione S-transferase